MCLTRVWAQSRDPGPLDPDGWQSSVRGTQHLCSCLLTKLHWRRVWFSVSWDNCSRGRLLVKADLLSSNWKRWEATHLVRPRVTLTRHRCWLLRMNTMNEKGEDVIAVLSSLKASDANRFVSGLTSPGKTFFFVAYICPIQINESHLIWWTTNLTFIKCFCISAQLSENVIEGCEHATAIWGGSPQLLGMDKQFDIWVCSILQEKHIKASITWGGG